MGGIQPRPSCVPNPCHPGVKCKETPQGVKCGDCPDGMEGDGAHCTDVDEVRRHRVSTVLTLSLLWCPPKRRSDKKGLAPSGNTINNTKRIEI